MRKLVVVLVIACALIPVSASAQAEYGKRVVSRDGKWLLPVASNMLGSDEHDHHSRGSVDAWDVTAAVGSPVFPIADGVVEYAGCNNAGGYGCWLFINHGTAKAIYAHCAEGSLRVTNRQKVTQWTQLCNVGMTGMTSWPHVHLEIHKIGGGRYRIEQFFDRSQVYYCKFCRSNNEPGAQITGVAQRTASGTPQVATVPALPYWWLLAAFAVLSVLYLVSGYSAWTRHAIYHGMALYMVFVSYLLIGGQMPTLTVQAKASAPTAGGWEAAYKLTIGSEGNSCTHDPVRTFGGVTQATYTAWRKSHGLSSADVCGSMTEKERQAIFIERYWIASGADKMDSELALTHVDFAFNAGVGTAKTALMVSGGDVRKYNDFRENFYKEARLCRLYCAGWLNRLNRVRQLTER